MNQSNNIINELRPANPVSVLGDLISPRQNKTIEKRLALNSIADGAVALIRADDGGMYEVIIRAAVDGKFKGLFRNILGKKKEGVGSLSSLGTVPNPGAGSRRKRKKVKNANVYNTDRV